MLLRSSQGDEVGCECGCGPVDTWSQKSCWKAGSRKTWPTQRHGMRYFFFQGHFGVREVQRSFIV